jgi:hypothetical protein
MLINMNKPADAVADFTMVIKMEAKNYRAFHHRGMAWLNQIR